MLHPHIPVLPAGKVRLAHGAVPREEFVKITVLATAPRASDPRITLRLEHSTRGWAIAGSASRWDEEYYAVRFTAPDGSVHGRRFRTEKEARVLFDAWTRA